MSRGRRGLWAAVLCWAVGACGGGGSGGPDPIDVPDGLVVQCQSALDGGVLPTDGTWVDVTLPEGTCLVYRFDTTEGVSYTVQALIALGNVDFIVSSRGDFLDPVTASSGFGDEPESATFQAAGGTYSLALIGKEPTSEASIRIVENVPSPAGVEDCIATIDGGAIATDGTPRSDVLFPRTCILYTFEGTVDSVYELILRQTGGRPPDGLHVARDRDFQDLILSTGFLDPVTTLYPITDATQTYYVLTVADFVEESRYDLSLERGNAPIGLADRCFHAESRGPLTTDWSAIVGSLPPRECHLYTITGTAGLLYITGVHGVGAAIAPSFVIASDAEFRSPVTTSPEDVEGLPGEAFVAATTQTYQVAVALASGPTLDYSIRGLETRPPPSGLNFWCNRATPQGALTADAAPRTGSVMGGECATYTLSVQSGVTYALSATPKTGGVGLFAASDAQHTQTLGSSVNAGGAQGFSFVAPITGQVHIAVAGRADGTTYSVETRTAVAAPAGLGSRCTVAVDRGALTLGAPAVAGFAPQDQCNLYTFAGASGTSYTITVAPIGSDNPDLTVAAAATFSPILAEETTPGADAIVLTASATQTYRVAIHGFQDVEYLVRIVVSPPPPAGLSSNCTSMLDGGALVVGAPHTRESAVEGQCVVYSFPGTVSTQYTITMYTSRGDPSLVVASDAAFASILTTQANTGGETYAFTAASTRSYYLAVFPATASTTDFEIFVTSP